MAWNPFKKNKSTNESSRFDLLSDKLKSQLETVQNRKSGVGKKIEEIDDWTAQVIIDTYAHLFPNGNMTYYREQYKEKALGEYETIKAENADKISKEKVEKCDKIVEGYAKQKALRQSEFDLYAKLEAKYSQALEDFEDTKIGKKSNDLLDQHQARLKEMGDGGEALSGAMTEKERFSRLNDALEHETEYVKQLEKLSDKFDETGEENFDHSGAFKEELEKITQEIE
ncbi:MAG: hypothetical protein U9N85_14220 [Bacteroidota bacterium]|nr:hypothetical protein [Bacteroidota bacterium]